MTWEQWLYVAWLAGAFLTGEVLPPRILLDADDRRRAAGLSFWTFAAIFIAACLAWPAALVAGFIGVVKAMRGDRVE